MRLSFKNPALLLACAVVFASCSLPAAAQDIAAPKLGGNSTFDNNPDLSGARPGTRGGGATGPLTVIPEDFFKLKLGPGFLLSMQVYDAPEFSTELRVDPEGDVAVPLAGRFHVQGKTITEVQTEIAQRFQAEKILKNPQISLNIEQYAGQSVSVIGEVYNPGRLELLAPHDLLYVLAMAGGETQYAGNIVEIRNDRGGAPQARNIHYSRSKREEDSLRGVMVEPGDIVTVRRAGIVYVLGAVNRPGGYLMQEDGKLNVAQALSLAYGTAWQAAVGSIRLIRKQPDGSLVDIHVHYGDIMKGKMDAPVLQAEDILFVPTSKTKSVLSASLLSATAQAALIAH